MFPKKENEVVEKKQEPKEFKCFRHHRILHGGKQICDILEEYKRDFVLIGWDFEPTGNQYLLVVEIEPKGD